MSIWLLGALPYLKTYMTIFMTKLYHFPSNQMILLGLMVLMSLKSGISSTILIYGLLSVSVLISHLTQLLGIITRVWLKITILALDHDLVTPLERTTFLSSQDRSPIGLLITDLTAFRSSNDLVIDNLTNI